MIAEKLYFILWSEEIIVKSAKNVYFHNRFQYPHHLCYLSKINVDIIYIIELSYIVFS